MKQTVTAKDVRLFLDECKFYGFEVIHVQNNDVFLRAYFNPFNARRYSYLEHEGEMLLQRYGARYCWGAAKPTINIALERGEIRLCGSNFGVRFIRELGKHFNQQKGE